MTKSFYLFCGVLVLCLVAVLAGTGRLPWPGLKIRLENKSGYDLDSVTIGNAFVGSIKNGWYANINDCTEFEMQDGLPFGLAHGTIRGKQKDKTLLAFCGTGVELIKHGNFVFAIVLHETDSGYRLHWSQP
jgi:hypothetical protein